MSGTNPDPRPLPSGWISQYDDSYKAWFYIDTKANPPTPSWTHPLGPLPANPSLSDSRTPHKRTSYSTMSSRTAGAYTNAPSGPKNPDTRPLPAGWLSEYDESYKTWFYVDTKANPPAPSWAHPLGPTTTPVSSQAAAPPNASSTLTVNPGDPENPDKRPLPKGWTQLYDRTHKAFFYVDATVPHPTPSWNHPLGPAPPHVPSTPLVAATPAHVKVASLPSPQPAVPGDPDNPDKRPLPTGWIGQYDTSHKAWFYVNTAAPNPVPTWTHPLGPPVTSPVPGPIGGSIALHIPPNSGQPTNPDTRSLPYGWIDEYDATNKAWFYVDTKALNPTPSWTHPLGPPATAPVSPTSSTQNPDTRPLPPGWISEYDPTANAWFYVDTSKHPPVSAWTHPRGPAPPGSYSSPPLTGTYGTPASGPGPSSPYGAPAYGSRPGKDQLGSLLGGLLGGKASGKANRYLGSVTGLVGGKPSGAPAGQPSGGGGAWPGQPQPPYGAPPYSAPPPGGQYGR